MKSPTADRNIRLIVALVNLTWALWSGVGGYYFITAHEVIGSDTVFRVLNTWTHGYQIVGYSLLGCSIISLLAMAFHQLMRTAAIVCAVWCGATAILLQVANPGFGQATIDAWLLLMCSFTCVCRWALLVLEPHVSA
jgi:hypothetical protein